MTHPAVQRHLDAAAAATATGNAAEATRQNEMAALRATIEAPQPVVTTAQRKAHAKRVDRDCLPKIQPLGQTSAEFCIPRD